MNKFIIVLFLLIGLSFSKSNAQIDFDNSELKEGIRLYPDAKIPGVYYYTPTSIEIFLDREGLPDFKLIMMRYTGSKLSDDQKKKSFKNIAQFRVALKRPSEEKLQKIRSDWNNVTLKMMPLTQTNCFLVYTPINEKEKEKYFAGEVLEGTKNETGERVFTIPMSNEDAQVLEKSLQKGQSLISIGYSLYAEGVRLMDVKLEGDIQKQTKFSSALNEFLLGETIALQKRYNKYSIGMVGAGTTSIYVGKYFEKYIKKIDINEQLPAEFASIDVRCYDFNNQIRDNLYAKKVEIEATSVEGKTVSLQTTFFQAKPEIFVKNLKFNYAIKVNEPWRYRVIEIDKKGVFSPRGWIYKKDWSQIDVTTKLDF
jgi:hypothetical protein